MVIQLLRGFLVLFLFLTFAVGEKTKQQSAKKKRVIKEKDRREKTLEIQKKSREAELEARRKDTIEKFETKRETKGDKDRRQWNDTKKTQNLRGENAQKMEKQ